MSYPCILFEDLQFPDAENPFDEAEGVNGFELVAASGRFSNFSLQYGLTTGGTNRLSPVVLLHDEEVPQSGMASAQPTL